MIGVRVGPNEGSGSSTCFRAGVRPSGAAELATSLRTSASAGVLVDAGVSPELRDRGLPLGRNILRLGCRRRCLDREVVLLGPRPEAAQAPNSRHGPGVGVLGHRLVGWMCGGKGGLRRQVGRDRRRGDRRRRMGRHRLRRDSGWRENLWCDGLRGHDICRCGLRRDGWSRLSGGNAGVDRRRVAPSLRMALVPPGTTGAVGNLDARLELRPRAAPERNPHGHRVANALQRIGTHRPERFRGDRRGRREVGWLRFGRRECRGLRRDRRGCGQRDRDDRLRRCDYDRLTMYRRRGVGTRHHRYRRRRWEWRGGDLIDRVVVPEEQFGRLGKSASR